MDRPRVTGTRALLVGIDLLVLAITLIGHAWIWAAVFAAFLLLDLSKVAEGR